MCCDPSLKNGQGKLHNNVSNLPLEMSIKWLGCTIFAVQWSWYMKIGDKDFRGRKGMGEASAGFTGIQYSVLLLAYSEADVMSQLPSN